MGRGYFLWFSEKYVVNKKSNMPIFCGSPNPISLPSFMCGGAPVSEIREWELNKKRRRRRRRRRRIWKMFFLDLTPFPCIFLTHFLTRVSFGAYVCVQPVRCPVNHKLKVIKEISLSTGLMGGNQGHPYIHSTTVLCDQSRLLCSASLAKLYTHIYAHFIRVGY